MPNRKRRRRMWSSHPLLQPHRLRRNPHTKNLLHRRKPLHHRHHGRRASVARTSPAHRLSFLRTPHFTAYITDSTSCLKSWPADVYTTRLAHTWHIHHICDPRPHFCNKLFPRSGASVRKCSPRKARIDIAKFDFTQSSLVLQHSTQCNMDPCFMVRSIGENTTPRFIDLR